MPLDNANKIAHISAVVQRSWQGRQKTVVFVYDNAGSYTYTAQRVIFRPQEIVDPQIPARAGGAPGVAADVVMICALSISMGGVLYVADTVTASSAAVAAAAKYEIIEAVPTGIIPGGTHYTVALRRLR
ncbi:MAG TPA: hypothetical protein VGD98_23270 [Ktedonobacteraceae bacterium]